MSSCLSGGGRTYGFDLEIVKSQSPSTTRTSQSSSPSSTLSESINSPLAISTRKPRTPRKRPNQTYNEAAALLSTVYPNIFSTKHLISQQQQHQQQSSLKYTTKVHDAFAEEFAELLPPSPAFDNTEFLINQHQIPVKPSFEFALKSPNSGEIPCQFAAADYDFPCKEDRFEEDFDAESILDEEIETGIDSIMGNLSVKNNDSIDGLNVQLPNYNDHYNWNPMGLGFNGNFDFGFGTCRGVRAFRRVDDGDWWRFPTVDVLAISPKLNKASASSSEKNNNNKKKKKKVETSEEERRACSRPCKENSNWTPANAAGLGLKLNYEDVLNAWSDRGLPFSEEFPGIDSSDSDAIARLAQIDLFSENGGIREASVLRYREKRRSRLFSKKIRYQVRKVNADRRPRMKGRFVRRPNSSMGGQETKRK